MRLKLRAVFFLTLSTCTLCALAQETDAFEDQVAEYIRRYPYQLTYDYTVRFTGGDPRKLNRWLSEEPTLVRAGEDVVPRTNNDTYYKVAALFLENGPVIIESSAPADERFNSFQLVDDRNANYRNIVFPAGRYTLYFGARPQELEGEAIEVPSALSVLIARVEVRDRNDPGDVAAAKALYAGMRLSGGAQPAELPKVDLLSIYPADAVAEAHRRLDEVFATVPFSRTVVGPGREPGRDVPYLYHAAGTKGGWGGPDPAHSAYEAILFDKEGNEMRGSNGIYAVTTEAPPVDAFWSVTVYDTERGGYLHPNDADRYHFNGTTAVGNDDGTVTFTFKRACGTSDKNCLEVPAGRFDVVARYYLPREAVISGEWRFPGIELAR